MIPRYLFIDDETGAATQALLDGFNDTKHINIAALKIKKNEAFEHVCNKIKNEFSNHNFDGVLIDLCLDGTGENSLALKAQPFAQQIRTWAVENKIPYSPIVLCSTFEKKDVFNKDTASHDLFDYYIDKTEIAYQEEAIRLKALAEGYQLLNRKDIKIEFFLNREDVAKTNENIVDFFSGNQSTFDIAYRLLKDVFPYSGILIDEDVVAARMGVDKNASGESWVNLRNGIREHALYTGVFSSGWLRYWSDQVNEFFMKLTDGNPYQILNADERVKALIKAGYSGLVAAKPISYNESTYFNTICLSCRCPMDSMEGIAIEERMTLKPWQENRYVSFLAVAKGDYSEKTISPEGLKKIAEIKQRLENEQA